MAESISPERMQRLMELSNNAMTVELGALRNPQVTTVPLSEPEAFYKTTPNVERFRNNMLRRQYKIIEVNNDKLQFEKRYADADPLPEHKKRELNLEIIDAQKEIEKIKNYTEEAVAAHVKGLQLETVADIEGDFSLSGLDQARDQLVLSDSAEDTVLAHELGHGAFSEATDFFLRKIKELGSITAAEEAVSLEYGEAISRAVAKDLRNTKTIGFPDTNEGTVQYYDNPQGDDPLNPGVGTPTFKGGATYYSPDGGFKGMDADFPKTTDPLLQKPFTDYRTGELVYHDEYKGDFEADLKEAGLMGFETLMSDLISERKGVDRFAERQRRGLKINPLGAPKGEVLRSVRPQTRPENFAQGGPVMRGIGTLNETARNMTRGPRGIGAYQQFASGGEAMGPPPTRGPDPQGIGYFQQFADGGPVYMNNGGEGGVERIKDGVLQTVFDIESNGDFNRWHDDAQNIPETPLTQMTVLEIMGYQGNDNGPAAGAGQIKFDTFQYLLDNGTLKPDEVFSQQAQRKAHSRLLDRRGFNEWVQGELSNDGFIQRLAREYAAVPLAQDEQVGDTLRESGKSRYGGSNAHGISLNNMRNVLTSLKTPPMASEAALDEAMYAADYLEPQTMPLFAEPEEAGPDLIDAQTFDSGVGSIMSPTTGEELRQGFRPRFGSPAQEDDYMSMVPQKISMRDKYSTENIAADLVGGKEALEEGIGGLTRSLNQPFVKPASKTLDRGSVPVQPFQKGVPDILRAGVAQRALRTPSSLTRKIKLPSGSVYEQGGAPRDDAKRYRDLGYADPSHSQAHSVTPNKRKIGYPKTSRLFRRNN